MGSVKSNSIARLRLEHQHLLAPVFGDPAAVVREMARSLTSGRYARADFAVGQTIRVGDVRGEIVSIESAATTLRSGSETIRIPNSLLVERMVFVEGGGPQNL